MRRYLLPHVMTVLLLLGAQGPSYAQVPTAPPVAPDTVHRVVTSVVAAAPPWYRGRLVASTVVPAVLIGYGISTLHDHGFYSSYQAQTDAQRAFPGFHFTLDNYLGYVSYLGLAGAELAGVRPQHDLLNTALLVAKAELLLNAAVYGLKHTTHVERPSGKDDLSFPSDHAAQAFLAASIVNLELRDQSHWYGVGAYGLATSVAVLRVLNNKHWESDVLAGAGFGILSAHLAYLTHQNRWGRPARGRGVGLTMTPAYYPGGGPGLSITWRPQ